MIRLTKRDLTLLAICVAVAAVSIVVIVRYFDAAFPEAAVDFRYDRNTSREHAERLLAAEGIKVAGMKHAVRFESDSLARIFLERSLGLERANQVMRDHVDVWSWHHRWFRPLVEEEFSVDIAPDGDLVSYRRVIPEEKAMPSPAIDGAKRIAETFLTTHLPLTRPPATLSPQAGRGGTTHVVHRHHSSAAFDSSRSPSPRLRGEGGRRPGEGPSFSPEASPLAITNTQQLSNPATQPPRTRQPGNPATGQPAQQLRFITQSERRLPGRMQRIFTWESATVRPAGAPYRYVITVDGDRVSSFERTLKVPDAWQRSYRELRSKNSAAGDVDTVLMAALMIGAVIVFIVRLRRGDLHLPFLLVIGAVSVVLVGGTTLNSLPSELAYYDTTSSYAAFLGRIVLWAGVQCVGTAMLLIVVCGAGEALYRRRLPQHLAIPKLATPRALASKRVFLSLVLGYTLVPAFMAYQAVFYLVAQKFGAWSPAEVPYDETLSTALPWVAVLFAGFFPAFSEEFLSRAFAIPFLQRFVRSRWMAIIFAAFLWGFGHATYPQQPFWIRGVEVGLFGVVAGVLMDRFGLLALLIWHYTVDAVYTATLLLASGNTYYVVTAALASLVFVVPLVISIVLYIRNKGFVPDDDLTNATLPLADEPEPVPLRELTVPLPEPMPATRKRVIACVVLAILAAIVIATRPAQPEDVIDYRITAKDAKAVATTHLRSLGQTIPERIIAAPVEGFRSWNPNSTREEGGAPNNFDGVAADYLAAHGLSMESLLTVWRTKLEAAVYTVRFFTPLRKEEALVDVDPRTGRPIGWHKYQDEAKPGAALEKDAALAIATRAFATYGVDARAFALAEALSFQQPARRDWLFHFEERTPLAARAFRRVTVRVAGNEMTQFTKHIKVPDSVYREAGTQTLLNIVFFGLQLIGMIALLALVIAGLVMASRAHGLPWRRAVRWTLLLAIIPIAGVVIRYESMLFAYSTSVAWETFRVRLATNIVRDIGVQLGVLFLAFAGLEAAMPSALSLVSREGRARVGRSAAVAAITALSVVVIASGALAWLGQRFPRAADIGLNVPFEVQTPLPALFETGYALLAAIVISSAAALYSEAVRGRAAVVMAVSIFAVMVDPGATPSQVPLMLVRALGTALVAWLIAKVILCRNPLAWPLTIFLAITLSTSGMLLQNQRADLIANGVAMIVIAALAVLGVVRASRARPTPEDRAGRADYTEDANA